MATNQKPARRAGTTFVMLFCASALHVMWGNQRPRAIDNEGFHIPTAGHATGIPVPRGEGAGHVLHPAWSAARILNPLPRSLAYGSSPSPVNTSAFRSTGAVRSAAEFAPGSTTCGLQEAHDNLPSSGGTIHVPPAPCVATKQILITKSGVHIVGSGQASSIRYGGTAIPWSGLIEVGLSPQGVPSSVNDFSIEDVSLDGNFLTSALLITRCTHCSISRVKAKNGFQEGGIGAPIAVLSSTDVLVTGCEVSGGRGIKGDGIYFGGVTRPQAINNTVSDVTRIGIVTEASGQTRSSAALVEGNSISFAHDSSGGQQNAGIWLEHTNGGRVVSNKIWNMSNNRTDARGIVIGPGVTVESNFILQDNDITGANIGYLLPSDSKIDAQIIGGAVQSGQNNAGAPVRYSWGVVILGPRSAVIRNVHFGFTTYTSGADGTVTIDMTHARTPMDSLVIENCDVETISHVRDSGDINIYSLAGAPLTDLVLRNLRHWKIKEAQRPRNLVISDSSITLDATKYSAITAESNVDVIKSEIIRLDGSNVFGVQETAAVYNFDNVTFDSFSIDWQGGGAYEVFKFSNCILKSGSSLRVSAGTGGAEWSFSYCRFEDYDRVNGAIKTSSTNTAQNKISLEIRNCEFRGAANSTPIRKWTYDPTHAVLVGNKYTSAYLHDFRGDVTQANNVRITY